MEQCAAATSQAETLGFTSIQGQGRYFPFNASRPFSSCSSDRAVVATVRSWTQQLSFPDFDISISQGTPDPTQGTGVHRPCGERWFGRNEPGEVPVMALGLQKDPYYQRKLQKITAYHVTGNDATTTTT